MDYIHHQLQHPTPCALFAPTTGATSLLLDSTVLYYPHITSLSQTLNQQPLLLCSVCYVLKMICLFNFFYIQKSLMWSIVTTRPINEKWYFWWRIFNNNFRIGSSFPEFKTSLQIFISKLKISFWISWGFDFFRVFCQLCVSCWPILPSEL